MVTRSPCLRCDWLQGTSGPDPTTVYVDMRALRHDRYWPQISLFTRKDATRRFTKH